MKQIIESWRGFAGATTKLYHYSELDDNSSVLDPQHFLTHRNPYTRRDYATSGFPRIFFYTDLDNVEEQIASGRNLYYAEVPTQQIYDIIADPDNLKDMSKGPYGLSLIFDKLFQNIVDQGYKGAYYNIGNDAGVVVWFEPISVTKMEVA